MRTVTADPSSILTSQMRSEHQGSTSQAQPDLGQRASTVLSSHGHVAPSIDTRNCLCRCSRHGTIRGAGGQCAHCMCERGQRSRMYTDEASELALREVWGPRVRPVAVSRCRQNGSTSSSVL
jgi:hypothetical protein